MKIDDFYHKQIFSLWSLTCFVFSFCVTFMPTANGYGIVWIWQRRYGVEWCMVVPIVGIRGFSCWWWCFRLNSMHCCWYSSHPVWWYSQLSAPYPHSPHAPYVRFYIMKYHRPYDDIIIHEFCWNEIFSLCAVSNREQNHFYIHKGVAK